MLFLLWIICFVVEDGDDKDDKAALVWMQLRKMNVIILCGCL